MVVPFLYFLYLDYENSGTAQKQRAIPLFSPIAEPLTAQDFRGERDVVG